MVMVLLLWQVGLIANVKLHFFFTWHSFDAEWLVFRVYSGAEFPGLKTAVFYHFWAVLDAYKRHTPLYSRTLVQDHLDIETTLI